MLNENSTQSFKNLPILQIIKALFDIALELARQFHY